MKKLKEKVLKTIILLTVVSSTLPFFCHDVYAESVGGSSPIIGVNITYIGYDGEVVPYQTTVRFDTEQTMWRCTSSHSTMGCQVWESENISGSTLDEITGTITTNATSTYTYRLYQYEFVFDKSYVGSITFNGNHPGATTTTTYYVNGNNLVLTDINLVTSFTIGSYNLTYAPLEVIDQMKQWAFPVESFTSLYNSFMSQYEIVDLVNLSYWKYPLFQYHTNNIICSTSFGNNTVYDTYFIIAIQSANQIYNLAGLENVIQFDGYSLGTLVASDFVQLYQAYSNATSSYIQICKVKLHSTSSNSYIASFKALQDFKGFPVYIGRVNNKLLSSDFALEFGLRNELLDNLNIIAQGTNQSNTSSSELETNSSDFDNVAGDVYNLENSFNTGLNNSLQQIDTSFDVGNTFGSKFLLAADWVRVQFNTITASNPFGTILSFSLLLGVALLIIGKVLG